MSSIVRATTPQVPEPQPGTSTRMGGRGASQDASAFGTAPASHGVTPPR